MLTMPLLQQYRYIVVIAIHAVVATFIVVIVNFLCSCDSCPRRCHNLLSCCAVDGAWSMWTNWADCNVTCGSGWTTRKRSCNNPSPFFGGRTCPGAARESKTCVIDCPGIFIGGQEEEGCGFNSVPVWGWPSGRL